ncbi:hypothetical protein EMCRGX_G002986 [Ephydatia muelleri]
MKVNDVCEVKWTDRKVYKAMIVTLDGSQTGRNGRRIRAQTESTDSSTESSSQCGSGCWLGDPNGEKMWVPGGDAKKVLAAQVVSDNPAKLALALLSVFFTDGIHRHIKYKFPHIGEGQWQKILHVKCRSLRNKQKRKPCIASCLLQVL